MLLQSNYRGVDNTLSTSNKLIDELLSFIKEDDDLDRLLEVYNKEIASKYKLKKAKTVKTAIRYMMLYLSYKLISDLKESLKYEDILNRDLFTDEYKKSITKMVNYTTLNKDVKVNNGVKQKKGYTTAGTGLAIIALKRMRNRANVIIDCNGVKLANEKLIAKVKESNEATISSNTAFDNITVSGQVYKHYIFNAVIDSRTTDICRSLNGRIFKIDEMQAGVNCPPMHINCRSSIKLLP